MPCAATSDADEDGFMVAEWGGDDCDQKRALAHPGATEVCDNLNTD